MPSIEDKTQTIIIKVSGSHGGYLCEIFEGDENYAKGAYSDIGLRTSTLSDAIQTASERAEALMDSRETGEEYCQECGWEED